MASQLDFDQEEFARQRSLRGGTWGRPVRFLKRTTSTNDLALSAIPTDARTGIVWLALEQTAGRGRRGSRWHGVPGQSLLMSVLLRWPAGKSAAGLSLATGLAVRSTCEQLLPQQVFSVKWPNDVFGGGRKVSGILVESRGATDSPLGVVVGIGLNLLGEVFDESWGQPTSLTLLGASAKQLRFEPVLAHLLCELERYVTLLLVRGLPPLVAEVNLYDALQGRKLRIHGDGQDLVGIGRGLDIDGRLRLETASGLQQLDSGHVELLPPDLERFPSRHHRMKGQP